jgi:Helix-turn-helix
MTKPGPQKSGFIGRLAEIASEFPSRAALAKAANLPPSSLQSYMEGTEPTRPALVALANAANVSLEWLADHRGNKRPHPPVPDGYAAIPFYDVRKSGGYVYPLVVEEIAEFLYLKLDWFSYPEMQPAKLFVVEATESLISEVRKGDFLVVDQAWRTKFMGPTPKLPQGNYLVSQQAKLSVRLVSGSVGDSVELVTPDSKGTEIVRVGDQGFTVHGRIIWYGRSLPVHEHPKNNGSSRRMRRQ